MSDLETIIGLEIHIQLKTASRLFSTEPAHGTGPNSASGPYSLGHPGTYPVLNERAVESAIRLGLAFDCRINPRSGFDRKHYFYPDLPRGYQITQQAEPVCADGTYIPADAPERPTVRIRSIHLEEDAGRLIHHADRTLVDYDRVGVPLLELVTDPDFRHPAEAADFLRDLRDIVVTLGIGDGRMEDGSIRCDANISVRPVGGAHGSRVEIKNMNSFRHVEEALTLEADRQSSRLRAGQSVAEETRRFDADARETIPMRSKETAPDYRFIPEPDLPPVRVGQDMVEAVATTLPERPDRRRKRLKDILGLSSDWARILSGDPAAARRLDDVLSAHLPDDATPEDRSLTLARRCAAILVEEVITVDRPVPAAAALMDVAALAEDREIAAGSIGALLDALSEVAVTPDAHLSDVKRIAASKGMLVTLDQDELDPFILATIREHPDEWRRYVGGKDGLLGFFVGRVLGALNEPADPRVVSHRLEALRDAPPDDDSTPH